MTINNFFQWIPNFFNLIKFQIISANFTHLLDGLNFMLTKRRKINFHLQIQFFRKFSDVTNFSNIADIYRISFTEQLVRDGNSQVAMVQYNSFDSWGWLDDLLEKLRRIRSYIR